MGIIENNINEISEHNSSNTLLTSNQIFTGLVENILGFSSLEVNIYSNSGSTTDGFTLICGQDKELTTGIYIINDTYIAGTNYHRVFPLKSKYMQIIYTNSSTLQTIFKLQAIKTNLPPSDNNEKITNLLTDISTNISVINNNTRKPLTLYRTEGKCRILTKSFTPLTSANTIYISNNTTDKIYYIYEIDCTISPQITTCDRINFNLQFVNDVYTSNGSIIEYNNIKLYNNYSNINLIGYGNTSNLIFGIGNKKTVQTYNFLADNNAHKIDYSNELLEIPQSNTVLINVAPTFNNPYVYLNVKWIEEDL